MSCLIRVLVVDDHLIVRRGLAMLLSARNGMRVVGEAATGAEAIAKARRLAPDVVLMDLLMPGIGGAEAIRSLRTEVPTARILVLTGFDNDAHISTALQAGAHGFLRKDTSADELFVAIRSLAKGASYLPEEIIHKLINGLQGAKSSTQDGNDLTKREQDVLAALAQGLSNKEVADLLCVSYSTVRSHVRTLLSKLGVSNRTEAAVYAKESGILCNGPVQR